MLLITYEGVTCLQDLSNLILALAYLIGAITTFYQVIIKSKRDTSSHKENDTDMSITDTQKKIEELREKLKKEKKKK